MAEYHVGSGLFGIYCGTLNKPSKEGLVTWRNKTECTDEALCAVRDFLKLEADSKKLSRHGYEWITKDGKTVRLVIEIDGKEAVDGESD